MKHKIKIDITIKQIRLIKELVCEYFEKPVAAIMKKDRRLEYKEVRQWIHFLCRENTNASWAKIAHHTALQDHATAINSYDRIKNLIETEPEMTANYNSLTEIVTEALNRQSIGIEALKQEQRNLLRKDDIIRNRNSKALARSRAACKRHKMPYVLIN
jgi:hypothetical protein